MRRTALVAWLALVAACSDAPPAPAKVALFGVDGATYRIIDPLLAEGRLPNLKRLIERGARSVLWSSDESSASPTLWTTIATGTGMATHGIVGFSHLVDGEPAIFASTDRRVPALWGMVAARGGTVGVAGYWNTWPAERVPGWILTDRFAHSHFVRLSGDVPGHAVTWPEGLAAELGRFSRDPDAIDRGELERWLGRFEDDEWRVLLRGEEERGELRGNGLVNLKYGFQAQESVADAALELLRTRPQPDFLAVFLELPDRVGHFFWHCVEPDLLPGGRASVQRDRLTRWANVVPGAYELVDARLGQLVAELDPDTTIVVVSDHGMQSSRRPGSTPADPLKIDRTGVHAKDGILVAAGPAIRRGAEAREAGLLDVAPTLLACMGLAPSTQFEGRVLEELLEPSFLRARPLLAPIEDRLDAARRVARPDGLDDEYRDQLEAIGYLGEDGLDDPDFDREAREQASGGR